MTKICVAIMVNMLDEALADAAMAAEHGADLVEYRVDNFTELEGVEELVRRSVLPCIVTCRPVWEGGQCELPDQERIPVLEAASIGGSSYIDVELVSYRRSANLRQKVHFNAGTPVDQTAPRAERGGLIVSSHDFEGRPAKLMSLVEEIGATGGDVVKIVWTARSIRDNLEAFEILRHRTKPTIALCMGEAGAMSRILAPKFGGFLTFASLRKHLGTAPGQLSLQELLEVYRFRSITATTSVYGVVGHPVGHSLSPHIHNAAFEKYGVDAVYVPMPVAPSYEAFKAFMESVVADAALDVRGLSVTLPHKEHAFKYVQAVGGEISEIARTTGAVNTIRVERDAGGGVRLRATSTDHGAILSCVELGLRGVGRAVGNGLKVAILGAGGTGRTAAAVLSGAGYSVRLYNRTFERAERVAAEFDEVWAVPLPELAESDADIFINTTTVGMHPEGDKSAWDGRMPGRLAGKVVFDTVYTPLTTTFLREAKAAGAVVVPGIEMFARQAAAQFEFWTGRAVAPEVFRERAESELKSRNSA